MLRKFIFVFSIIIFIFLTSSGVYGIIIYKQDNVENPRKSLAEEKVIETPSNKEIYLSPLYENKKPVNILLMGLDKYGERSDVIMLFNFDPNSGKLNLLSIARDTMVNYKGKRWKINELYALDKEKAVINKVQEITSLKVDYYISFSFKGFRKIIDALDGIEITVPFNMYYDDPDQDLHINLKKGRQLLNGAESEQFVRYRKGYIEGDIGRIKAQQQFVNEFINQKLNLKYLSKITDISVIMSKYLNTNISFEDISYYKDNIIKVKQGNVKMNIIPGESKYIDKKSYYIYDKEQLKVLINQKFAK